MPTTVVVNVQANTSVATANIAETTIAVDNLTKANKKLNNETEQVASGFEDVTKNGGAIAILDQLTGGLASRVRDTYEATKLFNFSLKGTKKALIATGIGAFVVLLGTVVAYWDEISDFVTGVTADLNRQRKSYEGLIKETEKEILLLEQQKELLILSEESTTETTNQLREQLLLQQEKNRLLLESYELELEKERAQNNEVTFFEKIKIAAAGVLGLRFKTLATANALNSESEKTEELETKITESKTKDFEISKKILAIDKERTDVETTRLENATKEEEKRNALLEEIRLGQINTEDEQRAEQLRKTEEQYKRLIDLAVLYHGVESEQLTELETSRDQILGDLKRSFAEKDKVETDRINKEKIDAEKYVADAKTAIRQAEFDSAANALGLLASLAPKSRALQAASIIASNAAGIARIVQQTAASNAATIAQGAALAIPSGGASVTAAAALVAANKVSAGISTAKGLAALKSGGSAGSTTSLGTEAPAPQAPSFNIVGQGAGSQIASALGDQQQTPIQAFVVSQDVTSAQSLENGIIQGATLGG